MAEDESPNGQDSDDTNPKRLLDAATSNECTCEEGNIICNPVLAYAADVLRRNPKDLVKKVLLGFYTPEEIKNAKAVLWAKSDVSIIGICQQRKGSRNKPRVEFETEDICEAIVTLLDCSDGPGITNIHVTAKDLIRMPHHQPGELLDSGLSERISDLESKVNDGMGKIMEKMKMLIEDNRRLSSRLEQMNHAGSAAPIFHSRKNTVQRPPTPPPPPPTSQPSSSTPSQLQQPLHPPQPLLPHQLPRPQQPSHPQQPQQPSTMWQRRPSSQPRQEAPSSSTRGPEVQNCNDFVTPAQHLRKQRRRERLLGKRTQPTDSKFLGAPLPRRQLFISRALPETTCQDVFDHVSDLNLNVDVYNVECVSHENAKFKSFVLTCNIDGFKRLLNADLWPEGCGVRKYNPPRAEKNAQAPNANNG